MELSRLYQYLMQEEENRQFSIIYALDGYDEVSLTGTFKVRSRGKEQLLSPVDLDLPQYQQADLFGGDTPEEAADIFLNILKNEGTDAQRDAVIANAGLAIHCIKPETNLLDCLEEARESIVSGSGLSVLKKLC